MTAMPVNHRRTGARWPTPAADSGSFLPSSARGADAARTARAVCPDPSLFDNKTVRVRVASNSEASVWASVPTGINSKLLNYKSVLSVDFLRITALPALFNIICRCLGSLYFLRNRGLTEIN